MAAFRIQDREDDGKRLGDALFRELPPPPLPPPPLSESGVTRWDVFRLSRAVVPPAATLCRIDLREMNAYSNKPQSVNHIN